MAKQPGRDYKTTRGELHNMLSQVINTMSDEELAKGFTMEVKPAESGDDVTVKVNWNS